MIDEKATLSIPKIKELSNAIYSELMSLPTHDNETLLTRLLNKLEPAANQLIEGKTCRLYDNVVFYVNVLGTSCRHYVLATIVMIKHYCQMRFASDSQTIIAFVINFIVYLSPIDRQ